MKFSRHNFFTPVKNNSGFMLLGMVFLALLLGAATVFVSMEIQPNVETSSVSDTYAVGQKLSSALNAYQLNRGGVGGTFPTNLSDLVTDDGSGACAIDNNPASPTYMTLQGWCGPYLDRKTTNDTDSYRRDGWGNNFSYDNATGISYSFGPNKTDDAAAGDDIVFTP